MPWFECSTWSMTLRSLLLSMVGLRPRPRASLSPLMPCFSKRMVHFDTLVWLMPRFFATSLCFIPPSRRRIILALRLSRLDVLLLWTLRWSSVRWSSVSAYCLVEYVMFDIMDENCYVQQKELHDTSIIV